MKTLHRLTKFNQATNIVATICLSLENYTAPIKSVSLNSLVSLSRLSFNDNFQAQAGSCFSSASSTQGNSGYFFSFYPNIKNTYVLSFSSFNDFGGVVSVYSQDFCTPITCRYIAADLDFSLDGYGTSYIFFLVNDGNSNPAFNEFTTVQISPQGSYPISPPTVSTVDIPALEPEILAMVIIYPIFTVLIIVGTFFLYIFIVAKRSDPLNNVMLADLDDCTGSVPKIEKMKRLCVTAIALTLLLWITIWGIYFEAGAYLLTIPMFILTCLVLDMLIHHERHVTTNSNIYRGRDGIGIALIVLSSLLIVNIVGLVLEILLFSPIFACFNNPNFCIPLELSYFILGCIGTMISVILAGISIDIGVTLRIIKFNEQATSNLPIVIASPMSSRPITTVEYVSTQTPHRSVKQNNQMTSTEPHWEQMAVPQVNQGV